MRNNSGRIEALQGSITIYSNTVENIRKNFRIEDEDQNPGSLINPPNFECTGSACDERPFGVSTGITRRTYIVGNANAPAAQILAQRNITFHSANVLNQYSHIYGGEDVRFTDANVINRAASVLEEYSQRSWQTDEFSRRTCDGRDSITRSCRGWTRFFRPRWFNSRSFLRNDVVQEIYSTIGAGNNINFTGENSSIQNLGTYAGNRGETRDAFAQQNEFSLIPQLSLANIGGNGLFVTNENPDHPYLIESRPLFRNLENYIGSDYFFERTGIRLESLESKQRLGDALYEIEIDSPTNLRAYGSALFIT